TSTSDRLPGEAAGQGVEFTAGLAAGPASAPADGLAPGHDLWRASGLPSSCASPSLELAGAPASRVTRARMMKSADAKPLRQVMLISSCTAGGGDRRVLGLPVKSIPAPF